MSIFEVPRDILPNIITRLDGEALCNLSHTCRDFQTAVFSRVSISLTLPATASPRWEVFTTAPAWIAQRRTETLSCSISDLTILDVKSEGASLETGVDTDYAAYAFYEEIGGLRVDLLTEAVYCQNTELVRFLLELFPVSFTAVAVAASEDLPEMLRLLLAAPNREDGLRVRIPGILYRCHENKEVREMLLQDDRFQLTDADVREHFEENGQAVPGWMVALY